MKMSPLLIFSETFYTIPMLIPNANSFELDMSRMYSQIGIDALWGGNTIDARTPVLKSVGRSSYIVTIPCQFLTRFTAVLASPHCIRSMCRRNLPTQAHAQSKAGNTPNPHPGATRSSNSSQRKMNNITDSPVRQVSTSHHSRPSSNKVLQHRARTTRWLALLDTVHRRSQGVHSTQLRKKAHKIRQPIVGTCYFCHNAYSSCPGNWAQ